MRFVVRALGASLASLLVVSASLLTVVPAARAVAGAGQHQSLRTVAADSQPLTISILGMTPSTAVPTATITLRGTLANHTGSAMAGITVQAMTSSPSPFTYPQQMTQFTASTRSGASALSLFQAGLPYQVPTSVPSGATVSWSVKFPASQFYTQFGVYPIQVQATAAGGTDAANARTFLPYWPGGSAASQVKGMQAAWVWPLMDAPQQGACSQTLATSGLSGSVAAGGRLSTLLDAGAAWTKTDQLTWNIDPALLSDVSVMTHSYYTGGSAVCTGRSTEPASPAAKQWLATLATSTAGESAFLSPYANVDVAALTQSGLDQDIASAYRLGKTVAGRVLPGTFGAKGTGTGDGAVLRAAWPADGRADASVLTSLAVGGGVDTVVLSSDEMPPASQENALARTVNSVGGSMSVLFADAGITSLLGAASMRSQSGEFALTQDFLAQTAMIASEAPSESRSLVIAPPANWDPTPGEADALLKATHSAQWLHSTALSTLATEAARLPATTRIPAKQASPAELSEAYLDSVGEVRSSLFLFKDLLYQPPPARLESLDGALATAESSAWRGRRSAGGGRAAAQLRVYLKDSLTDVQIIASKKLLLAGQSGETLVSVVNHLHEPVQVQVKATTLPGSQLTVSTADPLLTVQAGKTGSVRMSVHSSTLGTSTLQLQLATQNGSPLTWTAQPLSVEVTRFGRSLLIIIGAALGILVLTSAYRLRRKRLARARSGGSADRTADAGGAG